MSKFRSIHSNINFTYEPTIDTIILLQLSWNRIFFLLTELEQSLNNEKLSRYEFQQREQLIVMMKSDDFIDKIIRRDFCEELANNIPKNITAFNWLIQLNNILSFVYDSKDNKSHHNQSHYNQSYDIYANLEEKIKSKNFETILQFIRFLISSEQNNILYIIFNTFSQFTQSFSEILVVIQDWNSIRYLIHQTEINFNNTNITNNVKFMGIEDFTLHLIRKYPLNEMLLILKKLTIVFNKSHKELYEAIKYNRLDIIRYILEDDEALLPEMQHLIGTIKHRVLMYCKDIEIFKYFKEYFTREYIHSEFYQCAHNPTLFKYICEEYEIFKKYTDIEDITERKKQIMSVCGIGNVIETGNEEILSYIYNLFGYPENHILDIFFLFLYIRTNNMKMVKAVIKHNEKLISGDFKYVISYMKSPVMVDGRVKQLNSKQNTILIKIHHIKQACFISCNINMMKYVFKKFGFEYTQDLLDFIIIKKNSYPKMKEIRDFLHNDCQLKFNINNIDKISLGKIEFFEYIIQNYETQPVPNDIILKFIHILESLKDINIANIFHAKRLQITYLFN